MEKYRNKVTGEIHEGSWTTEHAASSYNQPVLIIDGQAVDHVWWERSDNPAAVLGGKGGSRNTDAQRKARAANGTKGGRPRNPEMKYSLINDEGCLMASVDTTSFSRARKYFSDRYSGRYVIVCGEIDDRRNVIFK